MSDHYETVFSCFLRDDTPESVLGALRRHMGLDKEEPDDLDPEEHPYPLLIPNNENSRLPGGDIASLRRMLQEFTTSGERYEWERFARCYWVDDSFLWLDGLLNLIAPRITEPRYGGHIRNAHGTTPKTFMFRDGTYDPVDIRHI